METYFAKILANLIKEHRVARNLTIEQLADLSGIHRTTLGLIERNERIPSVSTANQIASALGQSLSQLIVDTELILKGKAEQSELVSMAKVRVADKNFLRNEKSFSEITGMDSSVILNAIDHCYATLDSIDEQLIGNDSPPISKIVELANLSSMMGNLLAGALADHSDGLYKRNRPHAYPDLVPQSFKATDLELKMALETNKPKGHLPKAGTYITFRYVLGTKTGNYTRKKENRGDTPWIWEVKVGTLKEEDFSFSNTAGDSGKTAVIKSGAFNAMPLVYYARKYLPYAQRKDGTYPCFN